MDRKVYDILVLGSGPAGLYCCYYAHHKGLKPVLVETNDVVGGQPHILYSQKTIYDFPGFNSIKGSEITNLFKNQFDSSNTDTIYNATLECYKWNDDEKYFDVTLTNNQIIKSRNIIIAVGIGKIKANKIETEFDKNIDYFVKPLSHYNDKNVIILGGGDSAVDWANELANLNKCKSLTIIHRRDEFRANGQMVDIINSNKNINVFMDQSSTLVDDNTLLIKDNKTNGTKNISFDKIICQYGQSVDLNANKFLNDFNLSKKNSIIVDYVGQTNINNIYAIGQIAYIENKPNLICIAVTDAIKAIDHIIKLKRNYE